MGPSTINGVPAHVLLVHAVVVLVPLTALVLVVSAVWPTWIRRLDVALPLLALVTLISVPFTTNAGEWLQDHVAPTALVRDHTNLGDTLLPWVVAMFVVTVAVWWFGRRTTAQPSERAPAHAHAGAGTRWSGGVALRMPLVRAAAIVLSVVVAAGSVVAVYRIGDSGAKATWHDAFSSQPIGGKGN